MVERAASERWKIIDYLFAPEHERSINMYIILPMSSELIAIRKAAWDTRSKDGREKTDLHEVCRADQSGADPGGMRRKLAIQMTTFSSLALPSTTRQNNNHDFHHTNVRFHVSLFNEELR